MKPIEEPFEEEARSALKRHAKHMCLQSHALRQRHRLIALHHQPRQSSLALQTAARTMVRSMRSLDDSSNKRLVIPEPFLALDGCLRIVDTVARGLVVYPQDHRSPGERRSSHLWRPTEHTHGRAVAGRGQPAGRPREIIRRLHRRRRTGQNADGRPNDLISRLRDEPAFKNVNLGGVMNPSAFIGRSCRTGGKEFVNQVVEADPKPQDSASTMNGSADLKV